MSHTPTTKRVRDRYAYCRTLEGQAGVGRAEFDSWLAEVRREAWDACAEAAAPHDRAVVQYLRDLNPYRKEQS